MPHRKKTGHSHACTHVKAEASCATITVTGLERWLVRSATELEAIEEERVRGDLGRPQCVLGLLVFGRQRPPVELLPKPHLHFALVGFELVRECSGQVHERDMCVRA
jgi:hypothetical protein